MVYIERLQLRYFKSFKNVDITLGNGFVCLAGPNGSGKSNICDGIRFALGETSLKALRARKVSDLIMQGSEKAEIRLFLNNGKKIEVRRAIRRDGKTKYRYDGRRMTRVRVMEVLRPMGAQIGEHNVIAQGEVEQIIKMSPKERRGIIESVSGIAEFEEKKKEAVGELTKVEQKINDATIVMKEREGFLTELEKEKNDALRYKELEGGIRTLRGSLIHMEIDRIGKEYERVMKRHTTLKEKIDECEKIAGEIKSAIDGVEKEKNAINGEINRKTHKDAAYREIEELKAGMTIDRNGIGERKKRIERLEARIAEFAKESKALEGKLGKLEEERGAIAGEAEKAAKKMKKLEGERKEKLKGMEEGVYAVRDELAKITKELEGKRGGKLSLESAIENRNELRKMREEEFARIRESGESDDVSKLESKKSALGEKIAQFEKNGEELFSREKELNKKLPELDSRMLSLREELATLRVRAGSGMEALNLVMELRESRAVLGIHGAVADLCSFEKEYAVAIEAAAGNRMQHVVVEDLDAAEKAIDALKKRKAGRCTFLPLAMKGERRNEGKPKGAMGYLIDFVKFDGKYQRVFEYVFGETVLVEDMKAARPLVGSARIVTLEGELFEKSGAVTGGFVRPRAQAGRVSAAEIERRISGVKAERDALMAELESVRGELASNRRAKAEKEVELKGIEIEMRSAGEKARAGEEAHRRAAELKKQAKELESELADSKNKLEKIAVEIPKLEARKEELEKQVGEAEGKAGMDELKKIEEELAGAREEKAGAEARLQGKQREEELLGEKTGELEKELKSAKSEISESKKEIKELDEGIRKKTEQLEEKERKMREISSELERLFNKRNELEKKIEERAVEMGKNSHSYERAMKEMNEIAVNKATGETKLVDLKSEFENYKDVTPLQAGREELQAKLAGSESEMSAIGNVNLRAPEIYEEKVRDIKEVKEKVAKLAEEKRAIENVIGEVDAKKATIFMDTFNKVNDNFRKLFGYIMPGEAFLYLDSPSDPFNSGLHIKVRFEKNERALEAMSGGEKALVTLLLIFAMHMYRPAPFYLLDEVEAALDKQNSKKLADLLKQLAKNTQLIVITHNDQVLASADIALGVTKTAEGSKIVGIDLK